MLCLLGVWKAAVNVRIVLNCKHLNSLLLGSSTLTSTRAELCVSTTAIDSFAAIYSQCQHSTMHALPTSHIAGSVFHTTTTFDDRTMSTHADVLRDQQH